MSSNIELSDMFTFLIYFLFFLIKYLAPISPDISFSSEKKWLLSITGFPVWPLNSGNIMR